MGRLSLIVNDVVLVPGIVEALFACKDFAVSRIKNRLDPGLEAGYRDVQILVREPKGGFIVEVQVIPKQMYVLKQTDGYTKYRFILEACKRAKARRATEDNLYGSPPFNSQKSAQTPAAVQPSKGTDHAHEHTARQSVGVRTLPVLRHTLHGKGGLRQSNRVRPTNDDESSQV